MNPSYVVWGFYGHRMINRQAVFSLPLPLRHYFINHVERLSAQAVDADKRRYATQTEAFQHYFDTEKWLPFLDTGMIYDRRELIERTGSWFYIEKGDSIWVSELSGVMDSLIHEVPRYFTGIEWEMGDVVIRDTLAQHGLLPVTIIRRYHMLRSAFIDKDMKAILRHASDLGHYVGDAHVPLHTTDNYNGQKTGQTGIHAFWETSIPELLAEDDFNLIVGKAEYVHDVKSFAWGIVRESYRKVGEVLDAELKVRASWPDDQETCPLDRNGRTVFSPCPQLTRAYAAEMNGMVETQMRKAIKAIASLWWSAYVDAGQPILSDKNETNGDIVGEKETPDTGTKECTRK